MSAPAAVVTQQAEDACALLYRTLAAHRAAVASLPARTTRRRLSAPGDDHEQVQCQATLLRLLSITESFCAERLVLEVETFIEPSRHLLVSEVWDRAAIGATNTWDEQRRAYNEWLGVNLTKSDWKPIDRLAEARNAVAHGLGVLTRRQRRSKRRQSVEAQLHTAGITLDGDRIVLSDASLAGAAKACREFIEKIDRAVQQRPLQYK